MTEEKNIENGGRKSLTTKERAQQSLPQTGAILLPKLSEEDIEFANRRAQRFMGQLDQAPEARAWFGTTPAMAWLFRRYLKTL